MQTLDLRDASDAALAIAIGRFNQDALAEAYRRHSGAVFALARRLLESRAQAEEIVQEAFIRLWHSPDRFDPGRGSLRSYLLTMTHSRSVDLIRSESARRRRQNRDAQRSVVGDYDLQSEVDDVIVAEQVRDALELLTDDERAAIELAYFGGHTYREVAKILGEPEGTIKTRIRAGLGRLRVGLTKAGVES